VVDKGWFVAEMLGYDFAMPTLCNRVESTDALAHRALSGDFDVAGIRAIELKFTASTAGRHRPIINDLSQVSFVSSFVSSMGMGLLVHAARTVSAEKHATVLLGAYNTVADAIRISKLDSILPIARDVAHAIELAKSPPLYVQRAL